MKLAYIITIHIMIGIGFSSTVTELRGMSQTKEENIIAIVFWPMALGVILGAYRSQS